MGFIPKDLHKERAKLIRRKLNIIIILKYTHNSNATCAATQMKKKKKKAKLLFYSKIVQKIRCPYAHRDQGVYFNNCLCPHLGKPCGQASSFIPSVVISVNLVKLQDVPSDYTAS